MLLELEKIKMIGTGDCPQRADNMPWNTPLLTIILNKNTIFPDDRVGSVNYDNEGWTQDETI
ncbi:MAG: hypothetical protein ACLUD2_16100 [Clostridium sp.]